MNWKENKIKLKQGILFFLRAPKKFVIFSILFRFWLMVGVLLIIVIIVSYIESPPPPYSELTCQNGTLIKTGKQRVGKRKMHYINLKISEHESEFYFAGVHRNKVDFLNDLNGQTMTICFYENRQRLTFYNQYAEIIYQDKRMMNNYEKRRLYQLNNVQNSKDNFWFTLSWLVLLPLTLTIYILNKYQ